MLDLKNKYKISVIIPSFNHAEFIEETIESILSQSFPVHELIILDDGSTDNTRLVLEKYREIHNVKIIFKKNSGCANTINYGIKISTGNYITSCASDDYWDKFKLEKHVLFFEENQDYSASYSGLTVVDQCSQEVKDLTEKRNFPHKGGDIFEDILFHRFQLGSSPVLKKEIFEQIGNYLADMHTEDYEFNLRLSYKYKIGYIPDKLFYYRVIKGKKDDRLAKSTIISDSHLLSIKKYEGEALYRKAKSINSCIAIVNYAGYFKHKKYVISKIKYLTRNDVCSKLFLIGLVKLILLWK
ncbi:glycosyltransferase [Aliivibrio finisterrensis]|uniref:Glycosyltransferase n=1 Tax=Aliivibrio finisterrensis TaxID=511998 RepID=A0A4Q5KHJ0_9GAMM|nr:glycosyltransferase family 2 protein [Aliivibrio finisterrensis]RYU44049.1 glycosyltransferase [Aliivibrio finisterrensis]